MFVYVLVGEQIRKSTFFHPVSNDFLILNSGTPTPPPPAFLTHTHIHLGFIHLPTSSSSSGLNRFPFINPFSLPSSCLHLSPHFHISLSNFVQQRASSQPTRLSSKQRLYNFSPPFISSHLLFLILHLSFFLNNA